MTRAERVVHSAIELGIVERSDAHVVCLVSRVPNAKVTMDARLEA